MGTDTFGAIAGYVQSDLARIAAEFPGFATKIPGSKIEIGHSELDPYVLLFRHVGKPAVVSDDLQKRIDFLRTASKSRELRTVLSTLYNLGFSKARQGIIAVA